MVLSYILPIIVNCTLANKVLSFVRIPHLQVEVYFILLITHYQKTKLSLKQIQFLL